MKSLILISTMLVAIVSGSLVGGEPTADTKTLWAPPKYSKVVGYRYRLPSDDAEGPVRSGFTLLKKGVLDTAQLRRLAIKSADLRPEHINKLTAGVNAKRVTYRAACYDPHHIFVFYSNTGTVVAAVEVCFSCTGLAAIPAIGEPNWYRHDFAALARLTDELGLWMDHPSAQDWIAEQAERPIPAKKP